MRKKPLTVKQLNLRRIRYATDKYKKELRKLNNDILQIESMIHRTQTQLENLEFYAIKIRQQMYQTRIELKKIEDVIINNNKNKGT